MRSIKNKILTKNNKIKTNKLKGGDNTNETNTNAIKNEINKLFSYKTSYNDENIDENIIDFYNKLIFKYGSFLDKILKCKEISNFEDTMNKTQEYIQDFLRIKIEYDIDIVLKIIYIFFFITLSRDGNSLIYLLNILNEIDTMYEFTDTDVKLDINNNIALKKLIIVAVSDNGYCLKKIIDSTNTNKNINNLFMIIIKHYKYILYASVSDCGAIVKNILIYYKENINKMNNNNTIRNKDFKKYENCCKTLAFISISNNYRCLKLILDLKDSCIFTKTEHAGLLASLFYIAIAQNGYAIRYLKKVYKKVRKDSNFKSHIKNLYLAAACQNGNSINNIDLIHEMSVSESESDSDSDDDDDSDDDYDNQIDRYDIAFAITADDGSVNNDIIKTLITDNNSNSNNNSNNNKKSFPIEFMKTCVYLTKLADDPDKSNSNSGRIPDRLLQKIKQARKLDTCKYNKDCIGKHTLDSDSQNKYNRRDYMNSSCRNNRQRSVRNNMNLLKKSRLVYNYPYRNYN